MENRAPLLLALLLLLLFISTSSGFADLTAVQNQLNALQFKIIGEKLKLIQKSVLDVDAGIPQAPAPLPRSHPWPEPTREELSKRLEQQITILENVVSSLKPKAMEEETARIEKEITDIGTAVKTATGDKLLEIQNKLGALVLEHQSLEQQVRQALEDSLKYKQVQVVSNEIKILEQKIATLPRIPIPPVLQAKSGPPPEQLVVLQDAIQKLHLKILQAQVKVITEKVGQIVR